MCMVKKASKREIYASFGIEWDGKHIVTPWGFTVPELLTIGTNSKVGNAATWSMLPGTGAVDIKSCGPLTRDVMEKAGVGVVYGTCPCDCTGCYAKAGRYNFDSNKAALTARTITAYRDVDFFRRAVTAQIIADGITQVRIHAAGDFFGPEYVDAWKRIAIDTRETTVFWTYTKYEPALKAFADVDNLFITPSVTPFGVNFGTCREILRMHAALTRAGFRVHICACGTPFEKHCADCNVGCKAVGVSVDYVLFIKHSTPDYKAGKNDPAEYAAVCEIIKNQNN